MRRTIVFSLFAASVFNWVVGSPTALAQNPVASPAGFKSLIGAEDLGSWRLRSAQPSAESTLELLKKAREAGLSGWRIEDGELLTDGDGPELESQQPFGDCEIRFEAMVDAGGTLELLVRDCPILELSASDIAAEQPAGSTTTPLHVEGTAGAWNNFHCRIVGSYLSVSQAGKEVARNVVAACSDQNSLLPPNGRIGLNGRGGKVRLRNFAVREIPQIEANKILGNLQGDETEFLSLFNGRDFAGWIGAVSNYEVVDGTLRCRAGHGGNMLTAEQFDNFVVRLEFRLPPGGNNGLALRAPNPDGVPAYDGIEIQVLDDTAEAFASLESYQYNGSAYGLKAAHRGYLRPMGTWNYEEVMVDGDRVQVRLNGYQILDADLAQLRESPVDGKEHPGAGRTRGHFGFCGHSDPVEFRNIRIKPIETD